MIKHVCVLLAMALAVLLVAGLAKKQKQRARVAAAVATVVEEAPVARVGDQLQIYYPFWPPYSAENPVTNRNGFCLDVIRRIFPKADFIRCDRELPDLVAILKENPAAALVNFGAHPMLEGFARSQAPIVRYNVVVLSPRARSWRYAGAASLEEICLGYGVDYLEVPLVAQHWAANRENPARAKCFPQGSGMAIWMQAAQAGEIDAFIATEATGEWDDDHTNLEVRDQFRISEPIDSVPLYLTLSNLNPEFAEAVLAEFAAGLERLAADGTLDRFHRDYDLTAPAQSQH